MSWVPKSALLVMASSWLVFSSAGWAATTPAGMRGTPSELLYNFAMLSHPPAQRVRNTYHICAFTEDVGYLDPVALTSQKIQNVRVALRPLQAIAEVKHCNLLYIRHFVPQKPLELQQLIQKEVVLTVVDADNRFAGYGHIVISKQSQRYQFDLRMRPAKQAGIVFDARLMKLATNIINN